VSDLGDRSRPVHEPAADDDPSAESSGHGDVHDPVEGAPGTEGRLTDRGQIGVVRDRHLDSESVRQPLLGEEPRPTRWQVRCVLELAASVVHAARHCDDSVRDTVTAEHLSYEVDEIVGAI
jgi:hypothetical protein